MSTFDYNVDNYTITELFAILDLDDPDSNEIMNTTNKYITQFSPSNENQPQLYNTKTNSDYISDINIKWTISKISDEYLPKYFPKPALLSAF